MDLKKIAAAAVEADDLTVTKEFERELPRAGVTLTRFRDYIELGRHASNNPQYKPSLKAMLTFELLHPDHIVKSEDGEQHPMTVSVRLNKGATKKSGYRKLFAVMNDAHGGKFKHFVQLISAPFLAEVFHNKSGDGKDARTYANLDKDGAYSLRAPLQVDALTNKATPIQVPAMMGTPKVFLWENPGVSDEDYIEMWDSLFIEGTWEDEKDGKKVETSKNWIQETIQKNIEWEGSRLQSLLNKDEGQIAAALDVPTDGTATAEDMANFAQGTPETGQAAQAETADSDLTDDDIPW